MHAYSVWSDEHKVVLFWIATISVAAASAVHFAFTVIPVGITAPSAFVIYGVLLFGFDNQFWKWRFLRKIGLVRTPNFNGLWDGTFNSSLTQGRSQTGTLEVSQTWTKIILVFEGVDNRCYSQMASVTSISPNRWKFSWQYQSTMKDRRNAEDVGVDRIHYGTSIIVATAGGHESPHQMMGHYYTDENRKSYGQATFNKRAG